MKKEVRVYVIDLNLDDVDFGHLDEESKMDLAEKQGNVYSLEGFAKAINNEELYLDSSYIFIK